MVHYLPIEMYFITTCVAVTPDENSVECGLRTRHTDGGDDDDGVEERACEGPLSAGRVLAPVPPVCAHLQQQGRLELAEHPVHARRPVSVV